MAFAKIIILTLIMTLFTFSSVMSHWLSSHRPYRADKIVGNWYLVALIGPTSTNNECIKMSITASGNNHFTVQSLKTENKKVATFDINNNDLTLRFTQYSMIPITFQILDYEDKYQMVLKHKSSSITAILGRLPGVTEELFKKYKNEATTNNMVYSGVHFKNCPMLWKTN